MLLADRAGEPMERDAVIMTADACPHNGELAPLSRAGAIRGFLGLSGTSRLRPRPWLRKEPRIPLIPVAL